MGGGRSRGDTCAPARPWPEWPEKAERGVLLCERSRYVFFTADANVGDQVFSKRSWDLSRASSTGGGRGKPCNAAASIVPRDTPPQAGVAGPSGASVDAVEVSASSFGRKDAPLTWTGDLATGPPLTGQVCPRRLVCDCSRRFESTPYCLGLTVGFFSSGRAAYTEPAALSAMETAELSVGCLSLLWRYDFGLPSSLYLSCAGKELAPHPIPAFL